MHADTQMVQHVLKKNTTLIMYSKLHNKVCR